MESYAINLSAPIWVQNTEESVLQTYGQLAGFAFWNTSEHL